MTDPSPDLDTCAREPIRVPGLVQPHGALMALAPDSLEVLQISANLPALLELRVVPGLSLVDILGADHALPRELRRWLGGPEGPFLRILPVGARAWQVSAHRGAQGVIAEFEATPASESQTLEALYPDLRSFVDAVGAQEDVESLCALAARQVRAFTGFNRAMVYRFDPDWHGQVIAEDGDGVLPSYLHLRFPASDIPAQARELYRLNRLRLIPTADYQAAPLVPALSPVDGQPLDLSFAALRSVSPVHLQYMRNMGTGSSMSISIVVDGALWGLLSCHGEAARQVNPQVRTACDFLGQVLSLEIGSRERGAYADARIALKQLETELLARLSQAESFQAGLKENPAAWRGLAGAAGAALLFEGQVILAGRTPTPDQIEALSAWLGSTRPEMLVTDNLSALWPAAETMAGAASGLIAVSISQLHAGYILWFRPEVVRTVAWGGDPRKPAEPDGGRLSPRQSFAQWKEQVRLRSAPWSRAEVDSARDFRNAIVDFVLRRAEERAALTQELEKSNRELEAFSYSVSHDLRAPFRHIVGYAELLSDREKGLDDRSRHYLASIVDAAKAAGRLVDDLLAFSQLGRSSMAMGRIDMKKLVRELIHSHERDLESRSVDWRVGDLQPAWGDAALVRQALANLVDNAVKYTRGREPAVIEIGWEPEENGDAYYVRDNGVGFEMAYVGKLFGVFQRLHRAEEFDGTGIGLALSKRIIERHGGWIGAEGALNQGATFRFMLPKRTETSIG